MTLETLNINVDSEAARAYRNANEEQRRKLDLLLGWQIKECITPSGDPAADLLLVMKEMSDQARRNGLTPEILNEILNER